MTDYDIIIKGGTIVDGTRTPRYVSDIAIKDGKIAQIGGLRGKTAERTLDAAGRIVAPGFVDLHTHYDAQIFWDPYCTLSGWHGVTSVALGNCGFGFAPSRVEDRDRAMLGMTRNEAIPYDAMKAGMPWDWVTFPEFIDSLTRTPKGVNCLTYVPLTPLYAWVMGWEEAKKRRPTEAELEEMCRLIHEAMDAGACGWSAQVLGPKSIQRDYDGTPMVTDLLSGRIQAGGDALPNSLPPVIQVIGLNLLYLAGGIVVVEYVFNYPGIGAALVDAVSNRDIPTIQFIVLILAAFYVFVNITTDVIALLASPRRRAPR